MGLPHGRESSSLMTATARQTEDEAPPIRGRRVLVAEDSPITHDLLKLLLSQRGHQVDIATDGLKALECLRQNDYDVALLDLHLPAMDGLTVAATIRREAKGRRLPRFVAITGDVEGLLAHSHGCENMDHILPKPLDIYDVSSVVEEQAAIRDRQESEKAAPSPVIKIAEAAPRRPSALEGLGYEFIVWPDDLEPTHLSPRAVQASLGDPRFDGILIREHAATADLTAIWRRKALHVLPVIDLTGTLGHRADLDASKLTARDSGQLEQLISGFHSRRARLHRDLIMSDELEEQLIGRIYVSGTSLSAVRDPEQRSLVSYNTILPSRIVAHEAEGLCGHDLLRREFFDRFHICGRCDSARIYVREECSKCGSSDLVEEQYLHHFRCAYQGPESEFRRGDALICPKCRRELTHFGFDYDRPGTMIVCRHCQHAASDPAIGFVCLDCGSHTEAESCHTRDMYSYELTDQGIGLAEYGRSFLGGARKALRFAELPIELIVALNTAAKEFNDNRTPFALVTISYQNEREITAEHGARQFAQARDLFIDNLRAALAKTDTVVKGQSYDYALLLGRTPQDAEADFERLGQRAAANLRLDLGARFQAFGSEDFS